MTPPRVRKAALLLLAALVAGCAGDTEREHLAVDSTAVEASPAGTTATDAAALPRRPAIVEDSLLIEGLSEPVTLHLFDEAGVPFTTYLPGRYFTPDVVTSGEGTAVRFETASIGEPPAQGVLHFFFPVGADTLSTAALARQVEHPRGLIATSAWRLTTREEDPDEAPCEWATHRYTFTARASEAGGTLCIGQHGASSFYVLWERSDELVDGFGPRATVVVDRLRWRDSGAGLTEAE